MVTGGARRIGREIALALAEAGVDVAISYRRSPADETLATLQSLGVRAAAEPADLLVLDDCDRLIEKITASLGPIDILVNNASEFQSASLAALSSSRSQFEEMFARMTGIHIRAPLYLSLRLGLGMKKRGWGRIVNVTDRAVARSQSYPNHSLYLASKYGLHGATQCLALELAPEVTVNSIAPGFVLPPAGYDANKVKRLQSRNPLGRQAGLQEIAKDVLFLLRSEFKTGCAILSDGGESLRLASEE